MLILDTDHISHLQRAESSRAIELGRRLTAAEDDIAVTVIPLEEQMRGWLPKLREPASLADQIEFYRRLKESLEQYCEMPILDFDQVAATRFHELRKKHRRLGALDLKIAAIVLVHNATLLSANLRDFKQIEELKVEDWVP
jgi:tRNA(fMet)-specific endonuclease VapC